MTDRSPSAVLAEAAEAAGFAPSVHNTQPWRWRVAGDRIDLLADRDRQLRLADPEGRLLTMSCGAALHHAVVALAAEGATAQVERLPGPEHLARITLGEPTDVAPEAVRRFQALRVRHTDRRPVGDTPVAPEIIDVLLRIVTAYGIDCQVLNSDEVTELAVVCSQADFIEIMDPDQRLELAYWIGGERPEGTGVPDAALPAKAPGEMYPGRDFVRLGTLATGDGADRAATYVVLFGQGDQPADWLRAGEAMSACWLAATEQGVSVLPFSAVIEVPSTREVLRRMLSGLGYPYLVLRLGIHQSAEPGPLHTPRLPAKQLIEVVAGTP